MVPPPPHLRQIGLLLRQYRHDRAISQESLAERAGISTRTITNLESGMQHWPRRETLELLADALELPEQQRSHLLAMLEVDPPVELSPAACGRANTAANIANFALPQVGRERDIAEVAALLLLLDVRLLTFVGPPGAGKTLLGIAVARSVCGQFADGVRWVPLVDVADAAQVPAAIAQRLRIAEKEERSPLDRLIAGLRTRQMLLLLDNFEHLLVAAPTVEELLSACPRIKMLVTSRSALRLQRECLYHVHPYS